MCDRSGKKGVRTLAFKIKRPSGTEMLTMPVNKLILTVSLPLMISMLVQSTYNMVDSMFVAKMSEAGLNATSLAGPIQQIMISVAVGTGTGVSSLLARTLGAGKKKEANLIATTGLVLGVLSCLIFVLFGLFFARPFIKIFTSDPELIELGTSYLSICTVFSLGIYVSVIAERLLQATGNTFLSMVAQTSGAVINCILDPIMIFGLLGCPALGIRGAAIATVIGQWGAGIIALILNFKLNTEVHFDWKALRFDAGILKGVYTVGVPVMLVQALTSVQTMIINKMFITISATMVGFFGLFHKVQAFVLMPMNGLGMSLIPIVGQAYGARLGGRIRETVHKVLRVSIAIMLLCTVVFVVFPNWILFMFSAKDELLSIGMTGLRILGISLSFLVTTNVIGQVFAAVGNGMVNLINTLTRNILPLPVIYIFAQSSSINSIWWTIVAADTLALLFSVYMYRRLNRTRLAELVAEEEQRGAAAPAAT